MKHEKTKELTALLGKKTVSHRLMGPNCLLMLEELLGDTVLAPGAKVLDLGCGQGLTSLYLAHFFGVQVTAVDLWNSAQDNQARFDAAGYGHLITAVQADANQLPFLPGSFDAFFSVDAYQYFGTQAGFFADKIKPILLADAQVYIGLPGFQQEIHHNIPAEMQPFWPQEALAQFQTMAYWRKQLQADLLDLHLFEMACYDAAWASWLAADNPYARGDRPMMQADGGRYMNLIGIRGKA